MIAVIDYSVGNPGSILNMLAKIGAEAVLSAEEKVLARAEKLILPGVGSFDAGMDNLQKTGLIAFLEETVVRNSKPLLGICLGMQLLGIGSEEGQKPGLGWLDFENIRFRITAGMHDDNGRQLKIPHMGWNSVNIMQDSLLLANMQNSWFYFVHSYHAVSKEASTMLAETQYGYSFASIVARKNIYGVQFHPEKSHKYGLALLKNFVENC